MQIKIMMYFLTLARVVIIKKIRESKEQWCIPNPSTWETNAREVNLRYLEKPCCKQNRQANKEEQREKEKRREDREGGKDQKRGENKY